MEQRARSGRGKLQILREDPRCPYCHEGVASGDAQLACNHCRAWHHQACWTEGGSKCSSCGAAATGLEGLEPESSEQRSEPPVWGDAIAPPYRPDWLKAWLCLLGGLLGLPVGGYFVHQWWTLPHGGPPALLLGVVLALVVGYMLFMGLLAWATWPGDDDLESLRLPKRSSRRNALRPAIVEAFKQSPAVFHKRGLSLHAAEALELKHTLVLCFESLQGWSDGLLEIMEAVAESGSGTTLALVVGDVSDGLLKVLQVNCDRGILPVFALRADSEQLAALVAASGGQLVPGTRPPTAADVGRVESVRFSASEVVFGSEARVSLEQPDAADA